MTLSRQTEIQEAELSQGWTSQIVNAAGAETIVVKATPGKVARIRVMTAVITVTPLDGAVAAWGQITDAAEFNISGSPMQFSTDIRLQFSDAGTAWILYK
jgi:hypothetical protein